MRSASLLFVVTVLAASANSHSGRWAGSQERAYLSESPTRRPLDGGAPTLQPICGVRTGKPSYALGEPVKIEFIVENRTARDITLRFSSGQMYDIWVQQNGKEVWRWSRGRMFTQALMSLTLKPGEKKVFRETWKQVGGKGEQVGVGAYRIFAQLTTFPPRPTPVATQITIGKSRAVIKQTTVGGIVNNVDAAVGQLVQVSGTYRGWRPDPNSPACRPGPPVTRSDWAISDQTGCIFVTGKSGLDPTADYGKPVTVTGTVRKTSKGQPYIEARSVVAGK